MTDRVLVLLRHAKAEHPAKLADVDRPLTPRGHADSGAAGAWLASQGLVPDLVLCSPSRRTRDTWHSVKLALGARTKPVFDPRLRSEPPARGWPARAWYPTWCCARRRGAPGTPGTA